MKMNAHSLSFSFLSFFLFQIIKKEEVKLNPSLHPSSYNQFLLVNTLTSTILCFGFLRLKCAQPMNIKHWASRHTNSNMCWGDTTVAELPKLRYPCTKPDLGCSYISADLSWGFDSVFIGLASINTISYGSTVSCASMNSPQDTLWDSCAR